MNWSVCTIRGMKGPIGTHFRMVTGTDMFLDFDDFRSFDSSIDESDSLWDSLIATGGECHGTSLCSHGKISLMKRSRNVVPESRSKAKLSKILNQARTRSLSISTCGDIVPMTGSDCLLTFRRHHVF